MNRDERLNGESRQRPTHDLPGGAMMLGGSVKNGRKAGAPGMAMVGTQIIGKYRCRYSSAGQHDGKIVTDNVSRPARIVSKCGILFLKFILS